MMETHRVSETLCFLDFRMLDDEQSPKTQKSVNEKMIDALEEDGGLSDEQVDRILSGRTVC
jgi:hypothetical protein